MEDAETISSPTSDETSTDTVTGSDALGLPVEGQGDDAIVADEPGVPRDELHDSIDPATGTLTPEAVALRAERGINQSGMTHDEAATEEPTPSEPDGD